MKGVVSNVYHMLWLVNVSLLAERIETNLNLKFSRSPNLDGISHCRMNQLFNILKWLTKKKKKQETVNNSTILRSTKECD